MGTVWVLLAAGCAASQSAKTDASAQATEPSRLATRAPPDPDELPTFAPSPATAAIKSLGWGADGSLRVGFADGAWARVDVKTRQANLEPAISAAPVVAMSGEAKLAIVAADPIRVVRLRDQQTVLRLTSVSRLESAGFFGDGSGFFVAEPTGKLHVWGQSEDALNNVSSKNLKRYMARQTPDFTANLSPLRGQVIVTDNKALIMATKSGKVLRWKPDSPTKVDAVVKLPGTARSLGFDGRYVAATADDGSLRVISLFEQTFLPWSTAASGQLAAASPRLLDKFVVVDQRTVGMRAFADGSFEWKIQRPGGHLCGLTMSPDAQTTAVCIDSAIVLIETATGKPLAALHRAGDAIEWQN